MSRYPTLHNIDALLHGRRLGEARTKAGLPDGRWVEARAESWQYGPLSGIACRIRLAWLVFTGRCDALEWTGQP